MTFDQIKDDIDFLCESNSVSYTDENKIRNINIHYQEVASKIWEAAGDWEYDDSNRTDIPWATTTLVAGQSDYELPSTCQRLQRVEVKDGSGNYVLLAQKSLHDIDIATTEYHESDGTPIYYDVVGRSIILYPAPATGHVTLSAGLKAYFDRDVEEFTTLTAGSTTPGFATAFHRILSLGASIDYVRDENDRRLLVGQKAALENGLKRFYGKRNVEGKTTIKPASKKKWRQYT
jgi:hypothetical protein